MKYKNLTFNRTSDSEFIKSLQKRVRLYFKENNVSRHANFNMVFKTIFMVCLYLVPFFLMLTGVITNFWVMLLMWVVMGFGMAGIGFSIMHDANHGSYSKNQKVNKILGQIIKIVGGSAENWKIQHNVLHHSYTNIPGMDEDIEVGNLMRFSPTQKRLKFHRLQHIYAWFLYGLMTFMWSTTKDFQQLNRYHKMGLAETTHNRTIKSLMTELIISKALYYAIFLVIPLIFFTGAWWQILIMYAAMHYTAGLILSTVFQPAHVVPDTEFPEPEGNEMDNNWAIHQVLTTTNFAPKSKLFSWYIGGLNYQIEHHLFPNICHVHYPKISEIVRETAKEYNLPYYSQETFLAALRQHAIMLRNLGKFDHLETVAA